MDIMQTLQGFSYATTLDLNMGYYTIRLSMGAQKICTIVTPWGKYSYTRLPMGIMCAPDIFQEKMSTLMQHLEYVVTYLDDLLVLTTKSYDEHLERLSKVLERLSTAGLRINVEKSCFCHTSVEYLGYVITRDGIKPQTKKVKTIMNLAVPKTVRDVRRILGIIQYYRDLWPQRSQVLDPLTDLTSTKGTNKKNRNTKMVWTEVHQNNFDKMKALVAR